MASGPQPQGCLASEGLCPGHSTPPGGPPAEDAETSGLAVSARLCPPLPGPQEGEGAGPPGTEGHSDKGAEDGVGSNQGDARTRPRAQSPARPRTPTGSRVSDSPEPPLPPRSLEALSEGQGHLAPGQLQPAVGPGAGPLNVFFLHFSEACDPLWPRPEGPEG